MQLKDIKRGETFEYCGNKWIVLEHDDTGHTLVLSEGIIGKMPFDEGDCNNWEKSSLLRYLNCEYLKTLCNGETPDKYGFCCYALDLTTNDGLKDYGISIDFIFPLTCDMYRKNRDVIKPIDDWWWTVTASAPHSDTVYGVADNGTLYDGCALNKDVGVRPACYLKSDISLSDEADDKKGKTQLKVIQPKAEIDEMRERLRRIVGELASIIGEEN